MKGLTLLRDIISDQEEKYLLDRIYQEKWLDTYSRRTQQYGYFYDYRTRSTTPLYRVDDVTKGIPNWLVPPCIKQHISPDQIIVNEYKLGQGISAHTDALCFGPKILSLSLGADTVMRFSSNTSYVDILLPRRSLLILEDQVRYKLKHSIESQKDGIRVSITYRTISKS
jgi:alkylated DNA repair dioxygenase AlkB